MVGSLRRDIGLGGYPGVTLSQARDKAREARAKIEDGIDPVEERKAIKAALVATQRRGLTFAKALDKCLAAKLGGFRNAKHRQQWENTVATYATPDLGKMLVQDITTQDVLRVLQPIWADKTETASRLRGRIEAVLSWATVAGHRTGDNPARWASNLKELLPAPSKVAAESNHPALALEDAPRWFAELQARHGFGARALEFLALTATRSQEVRGARWEEIDTEKALWVIPAARMKMGKEHRIPLSARAVALMKALPRQEEQPALVPSSSRRATFGYDAIGHNEADARGGDRPRQRGVHRPHVETASSPAWPAFDIPRLGGRKDDISRRHGRGRASPSDQQRRGSELSGAAT